MLNTATSAPTNPKVSEKVNGVCSESFSSLWNASIRVRRTQTDGERYRIMTSGQQELVSRDSGSLVSFFLYRGVGGVQCSGLYKLGKTTLLCVISLMNYIIHTVTQVNSVLMSGMFKIFQTKYSQSYFHLGILNSLVNISVRHNLLLNAKELCRNIEYIFVESCILVPQKRHSWHQSLERRKNQLTRNTQRTLY